MGAFLRAMVLPARPGGLLVPTTPGDLIDKLSILEIKDRWFADAEKLRNVRRELRLLSAVRERAVPRLSGLDGLEAELKAVNQSLWAVEEAIRCCERKGEFGGRFVELARTVYRQNDRRAALKRRINELLGSELVEEKEYRA